MFAGATPMAMAVAHTQTPPIPPSQRTELPVPPEFDAVVLDCLAKHPDGRPPDAGTLARRLEAVPGMPPWCDEQAHGWWDVHRPVDPTTRPMRHVVAA